MITRIQTRLMRTIAFSILIAAVQPAMSQPSTGSSDALSPSDIVAKAQQAYAALSSYRDSGTAVHQFNGRSWTNQFVALLNRGNRYRVILYMAPHPVAGTNQYWSDGSLHRRLVGPPTPFSGFDLASNIGSTVEETIVPNLFYNLPWRNTFGMLNTGSSDGLVRRPDEKVGDADCYVLTRPNAGRPGYPESIIVWVGKKDFLIRRYQDVVATPQRSSITTQVFENISTNAPIQPEEFIPTDTDGKPVN